MRRLRIAVIGGGHLGRIHARLLKAHPSVELVGVVDPVAEARDRIATDLGLATFADHDQLIDRLDGAIVATNTASHYGVACRLLSRGVHVFVEKPLTTSVALADELNRLAADRGLILQAGHVERFNPAWRAARHHLHRPRFIEAVRTSGYTFRSTDIGVVLDLMIHDLDLVLATVHSELVAIDAIGSTIFGPFEDMAVAHLRFANGCIANLTASRTSFQAQRSMQIVTNRSYVGIDFSSATAKLVRPSKQFLRNRMDVHDISAEEKERLKGNLFSELLPLEQIPVTACNAIEEEQREFVNCILHGRLPSVTGEHARKCLAVAEQILLSMKQFSPNLAGLRSAAASDQAALLLTSPHWHRPAAESTSTDHRKAS